ncbi:hypothetical protein NECAME_18023 [Necator americanus]|uniref:Replication-associated protein ORF2/G2P domain-containing protein n=1 Tax=Necator americanus TaxID=51031 RepID=W2TFK5_NECAM|nr:hypothetical protein NECAME_18023 [Necator americanus]ETN80369.1 hypothetical protein NECAME_18023 [Necator americanus]
MKCDSPFWVLPKAALEKVPVPCGRCPPCKRRRVDSWVFRLLQEELQHENASFVTLTYDTRFVPISKNGFMTLDRGEFPRYMKRLRKLVPGRKLKYYMCGEYGSQRFRPHYHAIIFGVPQDSLFADAWTLNGDSLGGVVVGTVTGKSIAYTMKYIDKSTWKQKHGRDDRVPEFSLMSKGMGVSYLTPQMVEYHKEDISRLFCTREGGSRIAMPRYYRQKIYSDDDLKKQVVLIAESVERQEQLKRLEYDRLYGSIPEHTYEQWGSDVAMYNGVYNGEDDIVPDGFERMDEMDRIDLLRTVAKNVDTTRKELQKRSDKTTAEKQKADFEAAVAAAAKALDKVDNTAQ